MAAIAATKQENAGKTVSTSVGRDQETQRSLPLPTHTDSHSKK